MDLTKIRPFVICSHFTSGMLGIIEKRVPQCGRFFTGTHVCILPDSTIDMCLVEYSR